jgi:hypothetical protein
MIPVLLAVGGVAMILLGFGNSLESWFLVPLGYIALLGLLEAGLRRWLTAPAAPGRNGRLLRGWWWGCAACMPIAALLLLKPLETAALDYPPEVLGKLEACRLKSGRYPASLAEVDALNFRRFLVQYSSDGRLFEFTVLKKRLPNELWVFDGQTRSWSREGE